MGRKETLSMKSAKRILDNVVCPNHKTNALLACMYNGFASNGNVNVIELYEL